MKNKIHIVQGEIWNIRVDAIICHANTELEREDPITCRLLEIGGEDIQNECNSITKLEKGKAVATSAGNLPAQYLIHAVLQERQEQAEEEQVMQAMREALLVAKQKKVRTVSLSLIGQNDEIPIKRAAELLLTEIKKHFDDETTIEKICFVVPDEASYEALDDAIKQLS